MLVALTRPTGPELADCELTHIDRVPIDLERAIAQHDAYLGALRSIGVQVVELPRLMNHPDAVFVEDVALVMPEVAILLRPGAASRRDEVATVADELVKHRPCVAMVAPAALDGGDVIAFGKRVLVGETSRTNAAGIEALTGMLAPYGYTVDVVPVDGVLHLKSAATAVDEETLILLPGAVDLSFLDARLMEVPADEPQGANVVRVGDVVLADASAPATLSMLEGLGHAVLPLEVDEFAKAEGAISCKGVIFEA